MFFKETPIGIKVAELANTVEGIQVVVLTESFLKNKYEHSTDIDLLFIGNMKIKNLSAAMVGVEKEVGKQIRYSAIKKEDFDFARKKKEPFLMNILEKDKIIMFGQISDLL